MKKIVAILAIVAIGSIASMVSAQEKPESQEINWKLKYLEENQRALRIEVLYNQKNMHLMRLKATVLGLFMGSEEQKLEADALQTISSAQQNIEKLQEMLNTIAKQIEREQKAQETTAKVEKEPKPPPPKE